MITRGRLTLLAAVLLAVSTTSADAWPRRHHHRRASRSFPSRRVSCPRQVVAPGPIRVHDGDTFYAGAETIRLRGIDTPELGEPRSAEARRRLIQILSSGPVTIVPQVEDVYGRTVADVYVRGQNVADILRREGFQKPVTAGSSHRRT